MTTATVSGSPRTVPLSSLRLEHKHWSNPRVFTGLQDDALADLGADIKSRGIVVPLIVQKIKINGSVVDLVLEGQRRVLAGLEVLPKNAPIPVVDYRPDAIELDAATADDIMLDMLAVGTKREGLSSFELSEVADRLRDREMKLSVISKAIGKHESWVSKILKARSTATPKLMLQWKKGEVTDEQFKELAEVKEAAKQDAATKEVVEARKSGDKAEARLLAKEIVETAKRDKEDAKPKLHVNGLRPVVAGPQLGLPHVPAPVTTPKKPTPSKLVLEEMVSLADKRPPTSDYVKGLMDGVRYALGDLEPDKFARAWTAYLARIDGSGKSKKKAKAAKRSAAARKSVATKRKAKKAKGRR